MLGVIFGGNQMPIGRSPLGKPGMPWRNERRHARKAAQLQHPGQPMLWFGGRLYFVNGANRAVAEVPGVVHIPKPGMPAGGIERAQPGPHRVAIQEQRGPSGRNRDPYRY